MNNGTEIKYNKEKISHGIEELKQCQKELYEADVLFYKGIMALAAAKGINLIVKEDAGINLYLPEKIIIECREEIGKLIDEITTKATLIEALDSEQKETSTDKIQPRETKKEIIVEESSSEPIQALYAPPSLPPEAPTDPSTGTPPVQALYAPPGFVGPIEDIGTPPIQAVYAPPSLPPEEPEVPITQPLYGVMRPSEPIIGEIEVPQDSSITTTMPEYESIPNTSTPGIIEENYISKHPKLIGGVAAAMGLFGIPTILSDDFEDEEEKEN